MVIIGDIYNSIMFSVFFKLYYCCYNYNNYFKYEHSSTNNYVKLCKLPLSNNYYNYLPFERQHQSWYFLFYITTFDGGMYLRLEWSQNYCSWAYLKIRTKSSILPTTNRRIVEYTSLSNLTITIHLTWVGSCMFALWDLGKSRMLGADTDTLVPLS